MSARLAVNASDWVKLCEVCQREVGYAAVLMLLGDNATAPFRNVLDTRAAVTEDLVATGRRCGCNERMTALSPPIGQAR